MVKLSGLFMRYIIRITGVLRMFAIYKTSTWLRKLVAPGPDVR